MKYIIIILILCLGGALNPLQAQGKWVPFVTKYTFNGSAPLSASFLNEQFGFVETIDQLYRTTDGGKTWRIVIIKDQQGNVYRDLSQTQLYYYTSIHLFYGGAFESTDGGVTWWPLPVPAPQGPPQRSEFTSIYIHDSTFYSASGYMSKDHCNSWQTIDSFSNGEVIVGNLDSVIAIWGGSYGGNARTYYTVDGGQNWNTGTVGVESDFGYSIPFTKYCFQAGGDGNDAIERSGTGGKAWNTVYGPIKGRYLSDAISGDGCSIYAQTMGWTPILKGGVLKSTDLGMTWTSIGGPVGADDLALCGVCTRGTACFAMEYYNDTLWKYTDVSSYRPILKDTKITKNFPDVIRISECDSIKGQIHVTFSACDFIRLHDLRIDELNPQLCRYSFQPDQILRTGVNGDASFEILPLSPGTYNVAIHLFLAESDWSLSEKIIPFIIIVDASPSRLIISKKDTINFGTKPKCLSGGKDTVVLTNPGCKYPIVISEILLETDASSKADFSILSTYPYSLIKNRPPNTIVVDFHPQTAGIKQGKLIIKTNYENDTIPIQANVLQNTALLNNKSDSLISPLCETSSGFIHIANQNCGILSIDSIIIGKPFALPILTLPIEIIPGDSLILPVNFLPIQRGTITIPTKISSRIFGAADTVQFDTTLTLTGFATHGTSSYTLSTTSATFDTLHLCDSAKRRIVLYSTGCDSLPLSSILLSGDADFSLVENGTRNIATGDSIVLDVLLNPTVAGSKSAMISVVLANGSSISVPINAVVVRAIRTLSCDASGTVDFGKLLTCKSPDTTITLHNPGCSPVIVSGIGSLGPGFGTSTILPITIPPRESSQIIIHTLVDTASGNLLSSGVLAFNSDADNILAPITLTRSYIYPHPVHLWLDADKTPLTSQGIWKVRLKGLPNELADVRTIDLAINYNTDLLGYYKSSGANTTNSPDGKSFTISGATTIIAGSDSSIAEINFNVYLTKDTTTTLVLGSIALNSSDPKFMGCVAYPLSAGSDFLYLNSCGDRSIRTFMLGKPIEMTIHPNPARDEIEINLQSPLNQDASIEMLNALGAKVYSDFKSLAAGSNSIHLNTLILPPGMYLVRVNSGRSSASQAFVKVK